MTTELMRCPEDGITSVMFSPSEPSLLLVSSWDSKVRLYDVDMNIVKGMQTHAAPILDCCFVGSSGRCLSGGLGRDLRLYDFQKEADTLVGKHAEAVRQVRWNGDTGLLFSGSWDGTVAAWDARSQSLSHRVSLDTKVFAMALSEGAYAKLVVGDASKKVHVYDLRKLDQPEQVRSDLVKYQIRCLAPFADGNGFAVGTTEGRVAYEYFQPGVHAPNNNIPVTTNATPDTTTGYSFKCHRAKMQYEDIVSYSHLGATVETDKIFSVNAIAFNQKYNTFATGGGDGSVAIWDGLKKKRLWRLSKPLPTAVTALAFNADSTKLAVAVSHDFSQPLAEPRLGTFAQIIVKEVAPEDIKRRT
ncbi:putative mitotic checkpoint protein BUB3 [Gregarina niphandrodes]|uniref:Mitotic checkpoint protein BUB3 n=1 Tax=Gregarina niphandrodes TaxID=110365 RepID=A0A023AXG2_GRENI|nr:putative mitotic checkpoint protein BUB3 [Gregarina niphandrodes]EZG43143.1 putative mitotic checkpoint protein BUB3 [Gregarina niphandrodes]|eukprot:XP_011133600.1 putative mitotic checkpoint protein BUB3 [Gregarina niphandrodes]